MGSELWTGLQNGLTRQQQQRNLVGRISPLSPTSHVSVRLIRLDQRGHHSHRLFSSDFGVVIRSLADDGRKNKTKARSHFRFSNLTVPPTRPDRIQPQRRQLCTEAHPCPTWEVPTSYSSDMYSLLAHNINHLRVQVLFAKTSATIKTTYPLPCQNSATRRRSP